MARDEERCTCALGLGLLAGIAPPRIDACVISTTRRAATTAGRDAWRAGLGADLWGDLRQTDTYFNVASGRLKLRETVGYQAELIFDQRDEAAANRPSDYDVATTPKPRPCGGAERRPGRPAVVHKRRTLLVLDTTRVHIDNVETLGASSSWRCRCRRATATGSRSNASTWLLEASSDSSWDDCIRASYLDLTLSTEETRA